MLTRFFILGLLLAPLGQGLGQITKPADAPKPLSPADSLNTVRLPDGFRLELVAAEPLIRQPSGVCWDAEGNLFVAELHGYNREGQYDIEALNKTGELDRVVRRIAANKEAMRRAEAEQLGTVKKMLDDNGDGIMDRAEIWADGIPACLGICPARGGIIVVCSPDILFLADRDGDGRAEVRETLFTGFKTGVIERRINSPQWGPDNWIYIDGGQGGRITGTRLPTLVNLPVTGFRIRPDGSALEPVSGHTGTYGFTFNDDGDRFVISTGTPGIQVAPLPWRYLSRNVDIAVRTSRRNAADYNTTFPVSQPHPWRTKRADDPGFGKYYRDRYGAAESIPNGYFTSACSPLVYTDTALPGLSGQLLACAPAQNFVHRATLQRDGVRLNIRRTDGTEQSEFLASTDIWFHPIHLSIGPEGAIYIVDFYREIIEDYSAIPRYLQQQYGLDDGRDHGRIWRLVHDTMPEPQSPNLTELDDDALAYEVGSPRFWRRQTARRLLIERGAQNTSLALPHDNTAAAINALYTFDGLGRLGDDTLAAALDHTEPGVRRHALRLAERRLDDSEPLLTAALRLANDASPIVRLQLALSLGESDDARSLRTLADLTRQHGGDMWLDGAILSSLGNRAGAMLEALLSDKSAALGQARGMVSRLCSAVASRKNREEFSGVIALLGELHDPELQLECLKGLREPFKSATTLTISDTSREALMQLATRGEGSVRVAALNLTRVLKLETAAERKERLSKALREVADVQLPAERRLAAVRSLASENDAAIAASLLNAYPAATPPVRRAILETAFTRSDHLPAVVAAMEQAKLAPSALNAVQRTALLAQKNAGLAKRAEALLATLKPLDDATLQRFLTALKVKRDTVAGQAVFSQHCAICHRAHGIGFAVGPDLTAEFRRAEETIVRDILAPSTVIVAGHETYTVETTDGRVLSGLLAGESAASLTLAMAGGVRLDVLRKDIQSLKSLDVSLMPESLGVTMKPSDVANVIAWLRQPPVRQVLFDDNPAFVDQLTEGGGSATVVTSDRHSGSASLRVTPLQRHSSRIPGWAFRIRENPGPGEYRYLRLAWKAPDAAGVMVELANNGAWPSPRNPARRYYSGKNSTAWQATRVSEKRPIEWTMITRDLWKDFGDLTLTGIAPTAMGGPAWFDRIELLRTAGE
jgi:putative membrane-bound dehydrogenase-like protein